MWTAVLAAAILLPPIPAPADYQLGGAYKPPADVQIVARDRSARPAPGRYNICYINGFQTQPGELQWWRRKHPLLLTDVRDANWPDEVLLDTSTPAKRRALTRIERGWMRGCQRKGFAAVEADNLDSWTRSQGRLDRSDNEAMARSLIRSAHRLGLAIAQKNSASLLRADLDFDFAVVEQCQRYDECDRFARRYDNRIIDIEYRRRDFTAACRTLAGQFSITLRDRRLSPRGRFATC